MILLYSIFRMLLNKNYFIKLIWLFALAVPFIIVTSFSYPATAASNYKDCYDKKKSNQKDCLQSAYNQACKDFTGNKKDKCQQEESAKLDSAFDAAVNSCLQENRNQPDKNEVCKNAFVKPSQIGGYVSSQNSDDGDGSPSADAALAPPPETLTQEEKEIRDYRCDSNDPDACIQNNPIIKWLNILINLVAGIVGVGAVLMVIWAGIQYTTARDNAQAVAAAKQKIINVVIGIAAFIFLYAFLNWLVPGGVFK
jgi:ABC-type maltose transport system permease subunit